MATKADAAGDVNRTAEIRAAMGEIEGMVDSTLAAVAARADEFSGTAIGAQAALIDPGIDKVGLRGWLQGLLDEAIVKFDAATTPRGQRVASRERGCYELMVSALDNGVNPLATSNEQIAVLRINQVEPHYGRYADDVAAAAEQGYELVVPRPRVEDEANLYAELQKILVYMLSNTEYHRSAEVMGDDALSMSIC